MLLKLTGWFSILPHKKLDQYSIEAETILANEKSFKYSFGGGQTSLA